MLEFQYLWIKNIFERQIIMHTAEITIQNINDYLFCYAFQAKTMVYRSAFI